MILLKEINKRIAGDSHYCVLVTSSNSTISKEAREYIASESFVQKTIAKAIVTGDVWQRILANWYVKLNQPKLLTKIFDDRESALCWLRKQRDRTFSEIA